jgi:predicted Rossmann fold nucleotide-binding protein DprA/Smf involved in DNA uptake
MSLRRLEVEVPLNPQRRGTPGTALCRHHPRYPAALAQLDCAPPVLHATCEVRRQRELLTRPTVAIIGGREHTDYAHQITLALARDLAFGLLRDGARTVARAQDVLDLLGGAQVRNMA